VSDKNRAGDKISETARSVNCIKHCHSLNPMITTGFSHEIAGILSGHYVAIILEYSVRPFSLRNSLARICKASGMEKAMGGE
jgi:hypothetical protein